jgi:hypothetical protein
MCLEGSHEIRISESGLGLDVIGEEYEVRGVVEE